LEVMSISVAIPSVVEEVPAVKTGKFEAGVRRYAAAYDVPSGTDLLCAFRIQPTPGTDMIEASADVAAESSTGTWTEVWSNQLTDIDNYKAKVYRIEGDIAYIAYAMDLFEEKRAADGGGHVARGVFRRGLRRAQGDLAGGLGRDPRPERPGRVRHPRQRRLLAHRRRHPRPPQRQPRRRPGQTGAATEAVAAGKTLEEAARTCPELREAMEPWGKVKFAVSG
jgi:hypothetical protein